MQVAVRSALSSAWVGDEEAVMDWLRRAIAVRVKTSVQRGRKQAQKWCMGRQLLSLRKRTMREGRATLSGTPRRRRHCPSRRTTPGVRGDWRSDLTG